MTRDDIIRMAREAGAVPSGDPREWDVWLFQDPAIERFAALVAAEKDREILALKEERRKDMAEICSLRESEESLREKNEQFAALIGEYAAEQAPDALRKVVADRDALQTENKRLLGALKHYGKHDDDCGDHDSYNNATVRYCGCGLDDAIDAAMKEAALRDESAIWSARNDPRE
ncbi:MAG: hypothetical protein ACK58T_49335 [Phycisphaerae bacterium]